MADSSNINGLTYINATPGYLPLMACDCSTHGSSRGEVLRLQNDGSQRASLAILEDAMMRQCFLPPLLVALCLSQPAFAQFNPYISSRETPMNADDIAALNGAIFRLLDRSQLASGATENWSNPRSGAGGTVIAGPSAQRKGLACRIVSYRNIIPGPTANRDVTVTWCKTNDGWKIG